MPQDNSNPETRDQCRFAKKIAVFLLVAGIIVVAYTQFGDTLTIQSLAQQEHPVLVYGAAFLITLRLIPAVPFFVINAVMGLTPIRTRTF